MLKKLLEILIQVANELGIPTAIIGGLALPAYNVARTTLDIDFSIYVNKQEKLDEFLRKLKEFGIHRFRWDEEMVSRIRQFLGYFPVLAPEDFIVTKLGRADRSAIDVDDVIEVIVNNYKELDWDYLRGRVDWAGLQEDFIEIMRKLKKKRPEIGFL